MKEILSESHFSEKWKFYKINKFIMLSYFNLLIKCLKSPKLLNPNVIVKDITELNPENLKLIGIKYIVFDKDNTLTITHGNKFYN